MSNLKNVIIYLLSVLIAFESGVLLFIIGMFTVTNDLKNEQRNRRVSYTSYRKLKELYGEEAHQKIVDAIAAEKAKDVYITSTGLVRNSSLDFDEHDPNDERLFYDAYSNRYFESSINRVIQAEYHLNRDFVISGYLPANHFYQLLGLEPLEGGDTVGWSIDTGIYWIDFNHSKVTLDDGLEVLVIDMDWVPDAGWDSE